MNRVIFCRDGRGSASCTIAKLSPWILLVWLVAMTGMGAIGQTSNLLPNVGANWGQFRGDNMQRWNQRETVLGVNDVGGLAHKWTYATGAFVESSPAVMNGVVYIGSDDGNLYALNASSGQKMWSFNGNGKRGLTGSWRRGP